MSVNIDFLQILFIFRSSPAGPGLAGRYGCFIRRFHRGSFGLRDLHSILEMESRNTSRTRKLKYSISRSLTEKISKPDR